MTFEMLSGEPWCWPRHWITPLTDWYIWEIVIRPAVKKAREFDRKHGKREGVGRSRGPFKMPSKEQYVMVGERLGVPKEVSEAEYEKFVTNREAGNGR